MKFFQDYFEVLRDIKECQDLIKHLDTQMALLNINKVWISLIGQ